MTDDCSDRFVYTPLEPGYIRLLHILPESTSEHIRCSLEHRRQEERDEVALLKQHIESVDWNQPTTEPFVDEAAANDARLPHQYAALSYCWGNPAFVVEITVNGKSLSVTQNLFDFLRQVIQCRCIAESSLWSGPWWIDAICLNQTDIEEKGTQVWRMWRIYSQASFVYTWLGQEQSDTNLCFDGLHRMLHCRFLVETENLNMLDVGEASPATKEKILSFLPAEVLYAIVTMSRDEYWHRVWIVQELLWARRPMLMCGRHTARLEDLMIFRDIEQADIMPVGLRAHYGHTFLELDERCENFMSQWDFSKLRFGYSKSFRQPFEELEAALLENSSRLCSDKRDRIYAALSLPTVVQHESIRLKADYLLSIHETAAYTIAYLDDMQASSPEGRRSYGASAHSLVLTLLGIKRPEFRAWLQEIACWEEMRQAWLIPTASGTLLDCEGLELHHILHHVAESFTCRDVHRKDCESAKCGCCEWERKHADWEESIRQLQLED